MSARQVILAKATGSGDSDPFDVITMPITVTIYPKANYGSDTGNLVIKNEDGTWDDVYKDAVQVKLSSTNPQLTVTGGGTYRIEFSARTSAIGVARIEAPGTKFS